MEGPVHLLSATQEIIFQVFISLCVALQKLGDRYIQWSFGTDYYSGLTVLMLVTLRDRD